MEEPEIIFENKDFLAVNKPSGLMVHGVRVSPARQRDAARAAEPTLVDWLRAHRPEVGGVGDDPAIRPGIVHRLDKATSGVMVIAKTQDAFAYLKSLFQDRRMQKTYLALVFGVPHKAQGTIDAPIGIRNGSLKRSVHSSKMAKPAVTDYAVVRTWPGFSLLSLHPRTGRTHQLRVHLASIGHPIVGDPLYGKKAQPAFARRLLLHAAAIAFKDAEGSSFDFEAPLPPDFTFPQD